MIDYIIRTVDNRQYKINESARQKLQKVIDNNTKVFDFFDTLSGHMTVLFVDKIVSIEPATELKK